MNGAFDDMPPLVDPAGIGNPYPSGIPPPTGATFSTQNPGIHDQFPGVGGDHWGDSGWGDPVSAWGASAGLAPTGYPSYGTQSFASVPPYQTQNPGWYPPTHQTPPMSWGFHTPNASGSWSSPSSFGANAVSAPAIHNGHYNPSQLPLFGGPTTYRTPLMGSDSSHFKSYSPNAVATSALYGMKRSSSVGASSQVELARRPRDWRQDYKVRTGLASLLPRRQRSLSSGPEPEFFDDIKRDLHNFLHYNSFNPPIYLDLRDDPMAIKFHNLGRHFNQFDLMQYACEPPVPFMRLYHEKLPWYIDIRARNPSGVTIHDLFDQMHDGLMVQIHNKHYYNEEMDDEDRTKIAMAFKERCAGISSEIANGVRRVDFLKGRVIFEGLLRGRNGMWEMKTRKK